MTEPEELEDDLFADLYDGDDAAPKVEPISDQGFDPEPAQAPSPDTSAAPIPTAQPPEIKEEAPRDEDMGGNGVNGDVGGGWDGNRDHNGGPNHSIVPPVEEESRPIGIKEDG
ncbi:MAG: hypothetical protein OHK93_001151 [Ramalina farinacea]|uniref:Uncharacterized protein n=1 Tax=Ramalina farinacea TaxID=258253 RepID=A0AA43QPW6_9LECA|nr:hypothetical protein [Ramalina farinacea]